MVNASHRSLISISSHDSNNTNTSDGGTEREHRPNHRKNRQAPKPPNDIKLLTETAKNLEIRAPSELLLDFPTGLRTQWRHSAELLITGDVKYEVNVRGNEIFGFHFFYSYLKLHRTFFFNSITVPRIDYSERTSRY